MRGHWCRGGGGVGADFYSRLVNKNQRQRRHGPVVLLRPSWRRKGLIVTPGVRKMEHTIIRARWENRQRPAGKLCRNERERENPSDPFYTQAQRTDVGPISPAH